MSDTLATFQVRTGAGADAANADLSQKLNDWLQMAGPTGLFRTCGTCRHVAHAPDPARCGLYDATPPIEILLKGCEHYQDEAETPFPP